MNPTDMQNYVELLNKNDKRLSDYHKIGLKSGKTLGGTIQYVTGQKHLLLETANELGRLMIDLEMAYIPLDSIEYILFEED